MHKLLEDSNDRRWRKLSDSSFHQSVKLLAGFRGEHLFKAVVVLDEDEFKVLTVEVINVLLNFGIQLIPELRVSVVEFLHEEVKRHNLSFLYSIGLIFNSLETFAHPLMLVPVMLLLPFDL